MGRKKRPVYDIVATDSRMPRDGRFVEKVGQYNPLVDGNTVTILKRDRVMHWLRTGAQPTDTVRNLLSQEGLLLQLHMERKGKPETEIAQAVEAHLQHQEAKRAASGKKSAKKAETTETEVADQGVAVQPEEAAAEPQAETQTEEREVVQESSATEQSEERAADEPPTSINETPEESDAKQGE